MEMSARQCYCGKLDCTLCNPFKDPKVAPDCTVYGHYHPPEVKCYPTPSGVSDTGGGLKYDGGKLRFDLIPPYALEKLAFVYTIGAAKYGDNNWLRGIDRGRIVAAMLRHINRWQKGETVDPDDGQHPLASVAWCAFALMEYERLGLGLSPAEEDQDKARELEKLASVEEMERLFMEQCLEDPAFLHRVIKMVHEELQNEDQEGPLGV